MKIHHYFAASLLGCGLATTTVADTTQAIGWIENVQIQPQNIVFNAKIDTGADNSSIHASDIEIYEKDGTKMVKFSVENKQGQLVYFDQPLVRIANIKRKGAEPLKRPVVSMDLCIGNTVKSVHINLANRENFKYRMLIGRSYLKDTFLVDSNKQHTVEPACTGDTLALSDAE